MVCLGDITLASHVRGTIKFDKSLVYGNVKIVLPGCSYTASCPPL